MNAITMADPRRRPVGALLREWRERRRLSQLDLAIQADISARHLSFVETGRSRPTPAMILRLTEQLEVPLRERNVLLLAGGYAPAYPQHGLDAPELDNVRAALRQVLAGHEPYPAVVIDRWWDLQDANSGIGMLVEGCAPALLKPPVNVLRLSLHPDGMAPRIANLGQWRAHLLTQLRHRARTLGDQRLADLYDELADYPGGTGDTLASGNGVVLPLRYRYGDQELAMFSISATVGTATDVTVEELAIESFYPADAATAAAFRHLSITAEGAAALPSSRPAQGPWPISRYPVRVRLCRRAMPGTARCRRRLSGGTWRGSGGGGASGSSTSPSCRGLRAQAWPQR
jgi:transcriptional regulator with XRE-family HTH domain